MKEKVKWTEQQLQAIKTRKGTVLVSAAAGSGKTAVLVQRVIDILVDKKHPVDANRILVATFSNAAAQEMRTRIEKRLQEMIIEDPTNSYLVRQKALLAASHISTVHSFCLDIVRANFHNLNIAPDFRIGSENEMKVLAEDIAEETIEYNYEHNSKEFSDLVELVASGRDDSELMEVMKRLYSFVRSHPFYKEWLKEKLDMYDEKIPAGESVWGQVIRQYALDAVTYVQTQLQEAISIIQDDPAMEKAYLSCFESDSAYFKKMEKLLKEGNWNEICLFASEIKFSKLGSLRGDYDPESKELVQSIRKDAKKVAEELKSGLFNATEKEFREDIEFLKPKIETLFSLILDYDKRLYEAKKEHNILEFSDLEHFAIQLLVDYDGGVIRKTALAEEMSQLFEYIMVDEYQDTNATQDMIFQSVSRSDNLFMVGDVKQSIYRFRQAMPEIFISKRNAFCNYDGEHFPAKIILSHNFRSRKEPTGFINFLFKMLMSTEVGEINYDRAEELFPAAKFPEKCDAHTEVCVVENTTADLSDQKAEANFVAEKIKNMLDDGFTVTENGITRPVRPGDICILLRSMKGRSEVYGEALAAHGVESWNDTRSGFLGSPEVSMVLSILRSVDNPLKDISLTAAMMSPVYGFSSDDMAVVRMKNKKAHLFNNCQMIAMEQELSKEEKKIQPLCKKFVESLMELRQIAASSPSHRLIQRLLDITGIWDIVLVMKNGNIRQTNLRLLIEYAQDYEAGGKKEISAFLRFIDRMLERGEDWASAENITDTDTAVRIMSVHHAKGLEFPVVFLCDTAKKFNTQDLSSNMLLHSQLGFACSIRDSKVGKQYNTVPMEALKLEISRSQLSEEMRILYVALTRAKEKLVITMSQKDYDKKLAEFSTAQNMNGTISPYVVRTASSFADWILMSASFHPHFDELCKRYAYGTEVKKENEQITFTHKPDKKLVAELAAKCKNTYGDEDARNIVTKLSVSQIVSGNKTPDSAFSREPAFLHKEKEDKLSPAQRGTAMHTFLCCADAQAAQTNLEGEIARLCKYKFLSDKQAESLNRKKIRMYYRSKLFKRVSEANRVWREFPFQALLGKDELEQVIPNIGEHLVTVQGVADLIFEEADGSLVLVDFKTDWVDSGEELVQRYHEQLDLYAKIISVLIHKEVKEKIIYSLHLGKQVDL